MTFTNDGSILTISFQGVGMLALVALLMLFGFWLKKRINFLRRYCIPTPVASGLLFAFLVLALKMSGVANIQLDTSYQSPFMLCFFATVGLEADLRILRRGGWDLAKYLLLGGPLGRRLIKRDNLHSTEAAGTVAAVDLELEAKLAAEESAKKGFSLFNTFQILLAVFASVMLGDMLCGFITEHFFTFPSTVGAMLFGTLFRNLNDRFEWIELNPTFVSNFSETVLNIFLTISIMSMALEQLISLALPMILILSLQAISLLLFAYFVVYRVMGRNYDAAVMCGGLMGHGLGATPNAMANIGVITETYGPSTKAIMICSITGAFALDLEALERAVTPRTKTIIINTPNNPTGAVYSPEDLKALADLACRKDFYIISDEVYEKLTYAGKTHFCIASISEEVKERCVIINGFSKAYAMTGWRMGYAAADTPIIRAINSYQGHVTSNPSSIAQYASLEALSGPQESLEVMRREFDARRCFLLDRLNRIDGVHCVSTEGAFYLMPNIRSFFGKSAGEKRIQNSTDLANYLLDQAHVAVVPGDAFLIPDNLRISYSTSMESLKEGMDRIEAALKLLG